MEFDAQLWIVLIAAFGAGLIDAMVGGGGLVQLPALFGTYPDVPPAQLLGTNKFSAIFGTASAVGRFARQLAIPWRALLPLGLIAFCGSFSGAFAATYTPPAVFRPLVPFLLVAVLIYSLRTKTLGEAHTPLGFAGRHHSVAVACIGAVGFYDGFFGPGTGSFLMLIFVRLYRFDFLHAAAAARVLNVATNAAALLWFGSGGAVLWQLGAAMAVCNIAGALLGARLALRGGTRLVRKVFVAVVAVLIVRTAWTAFA
jgi:uncharacterized membrane protein YfcA